MRNVFERVLVQQANRLSTLENPTRDDLMAITTPDVDALRAKPEGGEAGANAAVELKLPEAQPQIPDATPMEDASKTEVPVDS